MMTFLILNAQSIRGKCKNRELITSLNHYTCRLAISYNEHHPVTLILTQTLRYHSIFQ